MLWAPAIRVGPRHRPRRSLSSGGVVPCPPGHVEALQVAAALIAHVHRIASAPNGRSITQYVPR